MYISKIFFLFAELNSEWAVSSSPIMASAAMSTPVMTSSTVSAGIMTPSVTGPSDSRGAPRLENAAIRGSLLEGKRPDQLGQSYQVGGILSCFFFGFKTLQCQYSLQKFPKLFVDVNCIVTNFIWFLLTLTVKLKVGRILLRPSWYSIPCLGSSCQQPSQLGL